MASNESTKYKLTVVEGTELQLSLSGRQGPVGPVGLTGAVGQAATIAVGTTTTGNAGTNASVTNSGTSSAAIFDFTIPRGDTGATGPQPSVTVSINGTNSINLTSADNNTVILCSSANPTTVTIPSGLPVGFSCMVIQNSVGQITFVAGSGVTLQSFGGLTKTAGQYAAASIIRVGNNMYNLSGNLV
jgi:hypothetical protein